MSRLLVAISTITYIQAQSLPKALFGTVNKQAMGYWVDSVFATLSSEEQLAQLIMPIIYPTKDEPAIRREEQRILRHRWGGILYQKGLLDEQLTMNLRLQKSSTIPLLIALDGEWGLHMRLKDAPRFPRNLGLGFHGDEALLYAYGREVARECKLMGIHINFAPTVDVNINPKNPVIGSRSFGENAREVSRLSEAYAWGLEDGGVLSVAKHFPGHGDTSEDSHKTLPLVSASYKRLEQVELAPFKHYIRSGFGGIMTAHLRIPALEPRAIPSSLSHLIVTDLLQKDLGFGGLIFTDGLEMKGVQSSAHEDIGVEALLAGNDILLGPSHPEAQLQALIKAYKVGKLPKEIIRNKVRKVLAYKYRLIISEPYSVATPKYIKDLIWTNQAQTLQQTLWKKSLYPLYKAPKAEQTLREHQYKRIAVVDYGKRNFTPLYRPKVGLNDCQVVYPSWPELMWQYHTFDFIIINSYSPQIPSVELQQIAKAKPIVLAYYSTPFKVKAEPWMQRMLLVWLTMEACPEAYQAVLSSVIDGDQLNHIPFSHSTTIQEEDEDPTAHMTKPIKH